MTATTRPFYEWVGLFLETSPMEVFHGNLSVVVIPNTLQEKTLLGPYQINSD